MSAENYIKLANLSKDLLVSRRQIEWKVCLAFWGAMVALVGFLLSEKYTTAEELRRIYWILFIFLFISAGVFTYWHTSLNGSNRKDLDLILYFREKAEAELGKISLEPNRHTAELKNLSAFRYALKRKGYINCFLPHIIITLIIFVASMSLLGVKAFGNS